MSRRRETLGEKWKRRLKQPLSSQKLVGYVRTKLGLVPPSEVPPPTEEELSCLYPEPYHEWIQARIRLRKPEYPAKSDAKLFSIITPVYDTPAKYLKEMGASVFAQDFPFEWVICDNGSTNPDTLKLLKKFAKDARVKLVRLHENKGIMGGTRAAFDAASGRYVLPVDSDDTLYSDALRVMASSLERSGWPALAYSDEDKIHDTSVPCWPFFKPDWDPALFWNCCYVAHLCAIDRAIAARCEAYTDDRARGCHDWDTFTRLIRAGHTPLHVPEVLYSWRIHPGSSASFADRAKSYTIECQEHVLTNHLKATTPPGLFQLRTNPLFGHEGMWHAARQHVDARPLHAFVLAGGNNEQLERCLTSLQRNDSYPALTIKVVTPDESGAGFAVYLRDALEGIDKNAMVAVIADCSTAASTGWAWEACGVFDLHSDAVAACGRILDANGKVVSAGNYFGFGGLAGSPDAGRDASDSGYSGYVFCTRTVSALSPELYFFRAGFVLRVLKAFPEAMLRRLSRNSLPLWLAAEASDGKQRVVYSPHVFFTRTAECVAAPISDAEKRAFTERYGTLLVHERYYPRFFGLKPGRGYSLEMPYARAEILNAALFTNDDAGAKKVDLLRYAEVPFSSVQIS
ncbi:MAG TPA: glycosyltransferase [Planctomycetota bacterium]|nr:glycosyltransferase [Planctomycetota bacterium]